MLPGLFYCGLGIFTNGILGLFYNIQEKNKTQCVSPMKTADIEKVKLRGNPLLPIMNGCNFHEPFVFAASKLDKYTLFIFTAWHVPTFGFNALFGSTCQNCCFNGIEYV